MAKPGNWGLVKLCPKCGGILTYAGLYVYKCQSCGSFIKESELPAPKKEQKKKRQCKRLWKKMMNISLSKLLNADQSF